MLQKLLRANFGLACRYSTAFSKIGSALKKTSASASALLWNVPPHNYIYFLSSAGEFTTNFILSQQQIDSRLVTPHPAGGYERKGADNYIFLIGPLRETNFDSDFFFAKNV